MKKLSVLLTALLLLASCSKGYKVTVTLPDDSNNGETAFLTNYDTGDTIPTMTRATPSPRPQSRTTCAPLRAMPVTASLHAFM